MNTISTLWISILAAMGFLAVVETAQAQGTGNQGHDRLSHLPEAEQASLLGKAVPCTGTHAFFMGMGMENKAYWSLRCADRESFLVELAPNVADSKVLECSILNALPGVVPCFKKFSGQSLAPVIAKKDDRADSAYLAGLASLERGDYQKAIAEFTTAIRVDPDDVLFSYLKRATAYEKKGDRDSAIADYRKALTLTSDREWKKEINSAIKKLTTKR